MHALVTGAAGFIGSHVACRLARDGWTIRAVDALTPYYDPAIKQHNLNLVREAGVDELVVQDVADEPVQALLDGVDVVFHLAAQPGVRPSWRTFDTYVRHNVSVTHRLLEEVAARPVRRFVYASSSSVYGQVATSVSEDAPTQPHSPYGVTKLAAEHLCGAYAANYDVPTASLRLFTVYGPRQRPDMAFQRLIRAAVAGEPFEVFGDGEQVRAFTFVDDVVDAMVLAAHSDLEPGTVMNVSGGATCSLRAAVAEVERALGREVDVRYTARQLGDVDRTDADIDRAKALLGWSPRVSLAQGIAEQVEDVLSKRVGDSRLMNAGMTSWQPGSKGTD